MRWAAAVVREIVGLFVDDGRFALLIAAWLALTGVLLPRLGVGAGWDGLLLFAGLAAILVESAGRRARR